MSRLRMGIMAIPKGSGSLVFREPNTNLLPNPEAFGSWPTLSNVTITSDALANPEGTVNADLMTDTGGGTTTVASVQSAAVTLSAAGVLYRYSVYFKAGATNPAPWLRLTSVNYTSMIIALWVNTATGALGSTPGAQVIASGVDAPISGWRRVWCTFNSVSDLVGNWQLGMVSADNASTILRDGKTINLWLAQLAAV